MLLQASPHVATFIPVQRQELLLPLHKSHEIKKKKKKSIAVVHFLLPIPDAIALVQGKQSQTCEKSFSGDALLMAYMDQDRLIQKGLFS